MLRREVLRYIYENGPITVEKGAARSVVADAVSELLQENYGMGSRSSVVFTLSELGRQRAIQGGDGVRYSPRHIVKITNAGKRELALHLRRANDQLNDELRAFLEFDDPDDDPDDDPNDVRPVEDVLVIDHVRSAGSAELPPDSLPPRASDVENMAALSREEHAERHDIQPVQPLVDTNALAHALLAKVMDATREDKDWAVEVERLEAELAGARSSLATAARQLTEFDKQRRAKLKALTDELAAAREMHKKLNETIAQVRAENESLTARLRSERRHRDNGIDPQRVMREHPALDARQQQELDAFAERLMKQPPGPGGSE
jgi:hypothetical protein